MLELKTYMPNIKVDLQNGIYVFNSESAIGKTRLYKELRRNQQYGEAVASYSYEDYLLGVPISNVLIPNKYKLIMLDRYDMYSGEGADLISLCKNNSIILIDCKSDLPFSTEYNWCTIEMTAKLIEVVE